MAIEDSDRMFLMKRLPLFLIGLSLIAAACGSGGAAAASIGDKVLTYSELSDLRPGEAVLPVEETARDLELMVITEILKGGAADLGISISDDEIAEELVLIKAEVEAVQGIPWADVLAAQNLTGPLVDAIIIQQLLQTRIVEHFSETLEVTDAELDVVYTSQLQALSNVCASHILFDAEHEALADEVLLLALAAESDAAVFADLAAEHSIGPSGPSGGDLGCVSPSGYVPTFGQATLDAEVGVPYGPVETQFGHHLILVSSRDVPELEDVREELLAGARTQKANIEVSTWLQGVVEAAEVTVDEAIGVWGPDPSTGQYGIVPAS